MGEIIFKKAVRSKARIKVSIGGPAGSGKSYTVLRLATGLAKKANSRVAMIGTEGFRNEYYSDEFDYDVLNLAAPFSPERYIDAINAAEKAGYQVCIIDSATHEWHGEGGILSIKDTMPGSNDYIKWNKLTPRHNAFISCLINCNMHVFLTARGKDQYIIEQDERGKQVPKKIGLGIDQRDGIEYEFTVAFMLDMDHKAVTQKDNTRIFDNNYCVLTEEHGEKLYEWAEKGESFLPNKKQKETESSGQKQQEEKDIVKLARTLDSWGKPIGTFEALTVKELDRIYNVCNIDSERALQITDELKALKTESAIKYQEAVEDLRFSYHLSKNIAILIEKISPESRQAWIDEKAKCKTVTEFSDLLDSLVNTLKAKEASKNPVTAKTNKTDPSVESSAMGSH